MDQPAVLLTITGRILPLGVINKPTHRIRGYSIDFPLMLCHASSLLQLFAVSFTTSQYFHSLHFVVSVTTMSESGTR